MNRSSESAAEKLGTLSSDKAELLKLLVEKRSRQNQTIHRYPRPEGASTVRLSPSWAQQRLWFIDQLDGGIAAYHVPLALRLRGTLDVPALQRALDVLVQRHETLRTVFANEDGAPKQEIAVEGRFALQVLDLSGNEKTSQDSKVRRHAHEESHGPFDLRTGPLIRGRLLRLGAAEHVLLVTMHHIVSDGWSLGVFMRELATLYSAYHAGRENPLAPLPIQYADYAQWQREWLQGDALDRQLEYWRAQLAGAPPELELPKDRPRPAAQSHRGEIVPFRLDAASSARLREFSQRHELTLFMVLYAGWAVLLSRLSGQEDVVIGTPVANRQRPEVEALIGFIVNTLALRIAPRGEMSVRELLEQVKAVMLGAYDHQDVPFEQVVEVLRPERSLNRSPVFQVMFTLQNAARLELPLPGMTANLEDDVFDYCKFDLFLSLEERDEQIVGGLNYATDLFDRATIERWIACFKVLLNAMTEAADTRIGELPILTEPERCRVIEEFNATRSVYPNEKLLHELFEVQVAHAPQAVAVECEDESLTYAELNARANQLARYLRSRGVEPDRLVGICVERSLEMVVGVLGILKAGGAYVPLDPNHPPERLQHLLEDAAPLAVLTQDSVRQCLPSTTSRSISVDGQWDDIGAEDDTNLDPHTFGLTSRNLAYVIYTSGSTGRPKGVMIEHTSAVNFWQVLCRTTHRDCRRGARVGLNANYTFDMSLKGLLQLLSGHCLVLVPQAIRADGIAMLRFISEQRIDALDSTPSQLQGLLDAGLIDKCPRPPTTVYLGGEPIGSEMWRVLKGSPSTHFFNMYGPTECTVDATIGSIRDSIDSPHIGKPIANTRVFILDTHLQPVPIGVSGEIYIGGAGVARGYLKRAALTAERFIPDPFSNDPQARLYKSGDLGRWRADGTLEYQGRNDNQVKIRGFRIELGEIEAQLARHENVKEAAVVAREDVPGERRLVAYVTPHRDSHPSVEALRDHLKAALPEHMIPSAFVVLESLPLTPNGKLDRRALPTPDLDAYVSRQYEPPRGKVEEILVGIWQALLKVERIGRHDNFFELGGHSLLATRVTTQLEHILDVDVPIRVMFERPTIEALARCIEREWTETSPEVL